MNDAERCALGARRLVSGVEPGQGVGDDSSGDPDREAIAAPARRSEEGGERDRLDVLEDERELSVRLDDVDDRRDAGVVHAREEARLVAEHLVEGRIDEVVLVHALEDDQPFEPCVAYLPRDVDDAHPARGKLDERLVAPDSREGHDATNVRRLPRRRFSLALASQAAPIETRDRAAPVCVGLPFQRTSQMPVTAVSRARPDVTPKSTFVQDLLRLAGAERLLAGGAVEGVPRLSRVDRRHRRRDPGAEGHGSRDEKDPGTEPSGARRRPGWPLGGVTAGREGRASGIVASGGGAGEIGPALSGGGGEVGAAGSTSSKATLSTSPAPTLGIRS